LPVTVAGPLTVIGLAEPVTLVRTYFFPLTELDTGSP